MLTITTAPLLSICIPTLNRYTYLKELMESLLPQAQRLNVEVCVSNNCSTDETESYLFQLSGLYRCLKFHTQPERTSLDENMGAALAMGVGHFLYPLGDDDFIPANTLEKILHQLDRDADLIVQNAWHTDANLVTQNQHLPLDLRGTYFFTPSDAFQNLWDRMPFGSFVFSRACFDGEVFTRYLGTRHAYAGVAWETLAIKFRDTGLCRVKCNDQPTVLLRGGSKTWSKDAAIIFLYSVPNWFSILTRLTEYEALAKQYRAKYVQDQTSINSLLQLCERGQLTEELVALLSREYSGVALYKVKIISGIPPLMAHFLNVIRYRPKKFIEQELKKLRRFILNK